jgi:septum formation topological specificity factor MinE
MVELLTPGPQPQRINSKEPELLEVVKDNLKVLNRHSQSRKEDLPSSFSSRRSTEVRNTNFTLLNPKITEK